MNLTAVFDKKLLKFIFVGVLNTIIGSCIMYGVYHIGILCRFYNWEKIGYWVSSASNNILTSIFSYFMNKNFTFENKSKSIAVPIKFAACISVSYILAYGLAKPLASQIMSMLSVDNYKLIDIIAMLFGMGFFTIVNYLGQRFVAFRDEHNREN